MNWYVSICTLGKDQYLKFTCSQLNSCISTTNKNKKELTETIWLNKLTQAETYQSELALDCKQQSASAAKSLFQCSI